MYVEPEEDTGLDFRHLRASDNITANEGLETYAKAADIRYLNVSIHPPQYSATLLIPNVV